MYSNIAESFNTWIKEARHLLVTSMADTIKLRSCVIFHFMCITIILSLFIMFVKCVLHTRVRYIIFLLCGIIRLCVHFDTYISNTDLLD